MKFLLPETAAAASNSSASAGIVSTISAAPTLFLSFFRSLLVSTPSPITVSRFLLPPHSVTDCTPASKRYLSNQRNDVREEKRKNNYNFRLAYIYCEGMCVPVTLAAFFIAFFVVFLQFSFSECIWMMIWIFFPHKFHKIHKILMILYLKGAIVFLPLFHMQLWFYPYFLEFVILPLLFWNEASVYPCFGWTFGGPRIRE